MDEGILGYSSNNTFWHLLASPWVQKIGSAGRRDVGVLGWVYLPLNHPEMALQVLPLCMLLA